MSPSPRTGPPFTAALRFGLAALALLLPAACAPAPEGAPPADGVAAAGYPDLRSVPPRPRLSYSIEQRRAIADGLVADREQARYADQVVRHEAGLGALPPPPPPPAPAPTPDVAAIEPAAPAAAPTLPTLPVRTGRADDGSLGSFLRTLEQEQTGEVEDPLPIPPPPAGAAAPAPPPEGVGEAAGGGEGGFTSLAAWMAALRGPEPGSPELEALPAPDAAGADLAPAPAAGPEPVAEREAGTPAAADPPVEEPPVAMPVVVEPVAAEPAAPTPPPLAPPPSGPVVAALPLDGAPGLLGRLSFAPGATRLDPAARELVETLATRLVGEGGVVRVVGGGASTAEAIDRALLVAQMLMHRGVAADRLRLESTIGAPEVRLLRDPAAG